MGKALFYHLTRSPAEALLPVLLTKALAAGWRVELRAPDEQRLDHLDRQLWLAEGFLAHGIAGGPHDARQPVLLTLPGQPPGNAPACLMALDGVEVAPPEATTLDRTCILFDGGDTAAVDRARSQWRALTGAGVEAEYWSEESGRWERKR
ncbi:DNA polymerase III subunit chi [Paracoccus liaowanqingii]|uniref:DNA polymerase III subunit chi n=1 Tax=Paracoccus liaowanqingii TaxID=2560053 RepID=A0A4Z1BK72_9RHOB|nr:DNA polymerase III subunit chi [Paracoccus liaowanqingii]TGN59083.1 DNA polymerase III subunit chi [Paracoccus liaowanqingii]